MDRNIIGPTLPPGFKVDNNSSNDSDSQDAAIGPSLPNTHKSRASIGPSLPPGAVTANQSSSDNECGSNVIGPSLPPGFKTVNESSSSDEDAIGPSLPAGLNTANQNSSSEDENVIGPVIPGRCASKIEKSKSIGPQLPSSSSSRTADSGANDESDNDSEDEDAYMGPALPPGFTINKSQPIIKGPSLPPASYAAQWKGVNPDSDEEDFNVVGPLPGEMARGEEQSSVAEEFEKRANSMKDKLTKKDEDVPLVRESWMLELPPEMGTNFGLSARKFRSKPSTTKGEDRSCWTDTPADRARKEQEGKSNKSKSSRSDDSRVMSVRDKMIAEQVEQYNQNKRKDTLLEMHQSERKRKKKEEKQEDSNARRPFDRDLDLKVNRFDDAQRKAVIKKSQKLNTRFSHGGSQFL